MSSLIIKITQNGSSQEYLFNKLGPIIIGSDKRCDLVLNDAQIEPKVLEIKVSGGNIFVKEVGARAQIYLDSVILPFREETRYHDGSCLTLKNTNYQIHITRKAEEAIEPPPFFEGEFKERLDRMNLKIREREFELKILDASQEKKKNQLLDIEDKYHKHANEKSKLEVEVGALKTQKEILSQEIRKSTDKNRDEEEKILQLREFVKRLENEERGLKDTIVAQNLVLTNLKDEREKKSKEVDHQRVLLANLQLDTVQLEEQIKELSIQHENQEREIQDENLKVQKVLTNSEAALRESARIQSHMAQIMKEKAVLDHEAKDVQDEVNKLEAQRKEAISKLNDLKVQIHKEEEQARKIQEEIKKETEEESNLKIINGELRAELVKAEEKLSLKKNQLNQLDFQNQDAARKLSTINFELERASLRLKELTSEERASELKMLAIREDMQNLSRKAGDDKKNLYKEIEDEKTKLSVEINALRGLIEEGEREKAKTDADHGLLKIQIEELHSKQRSLHKEKVVLEAQVAELHVNKKQTETQIQELKAETLKMEHEKGRAHRELTQLQIKLMDCETQIKEKQEAARIEMENYKRDERSKILAEKEVYLAEVEAFKQKSLIEVEAEYRRKQNDIHQMKYLAQEQVEQIISEARKIEAEITREANQRLKQATLDAQERESTSHDRIKQAQEYFKEKEAEADQIVTKARMESRDLVKRTEMELLDDLGKRKQKVKNFLKMKQESGLIHIKNMTDQHMAKLRRDEDKSHQKLEDIKRKELKKIARMREEELSRQGELKDTAMKELKTEKEKIQRQIADLKKQQETELADKKKTMLEHINSTKFNQQKMWEEELKREKEQFQRTKKDRILNATQAVMNVLVAETGSQGEKEQQIRDKIRSTLEMAIDGQNANALKEVEQVLDFNPMKRKKVLPVIKKYTLRVGIPAAVAIVLLADIGSVRTSLVDATKEIMKQRNSASEMYVNKQKDEWKAKHTFNPETTPGYKGTFVDNVIYTTDFEKVMDNEEFQNDWILKVHDFMVKDLELSEDVAINYISSEGTLIKELAVARKDLHPQFLDVGMKKLTDLETTHLGWLKEKIPDAVKMEKFSAFRKDYFDKFYSEKYQAKRGVATEAPKP
ncbi:FHA domain-containing protein [Peredibacter sp. HCB2-198]|uniref:FHA domain-containing protein n=1 Tax=Peredibacter sp. HCB2-198 TaxID=3383025 RepID=UPI0038B52D32